MSKLELYRWIKIVGMISFIPIILAAGPLTGYFVGDYLDKRFGWGLGAMLVCIGVGSVASITEVVRIIKLVVRIENKS